jgi:aspartyl-tRNA(Asn)/glutamyl-tRNA(Gln) amidotransferase subunit A
MADPAMAFASIAALGARYRDGSLSPVEVTGLCLERIEAYDPELHAFLSVLNRTALDQAATAEVELRSGRDRGPLQGVPVAIKDLMAMAGVPTKFGSDPIFEEQPERDAAMVRHLRAAGAVIVGKTNLLEFAYGAVNPRVGQTNNPWNLERTSGGSSGGSAAAVAAGLCYAAVGTDTGGSIRIPAAYCGVAGLKPTYGLVDLDGVSLLSWSLDHAGPIGRSCADAAAMLAGLTGQPVTATPAELAGLRLGVIAAHRDAPAVTPGVRAAFAAVCGALGEAGALLEDVALDGLDHAARALMQVLLPEASVILGSRLLRHVEALAEQTRVQLELGFALPAIAHVRAQQFRRYLGAEFLRLLASYDALLSPSVPFEAPIEDPPIDEASGLGELLCSAPTNLCGLPSLSVPCGHGEGGLPVGLQITGRPYGDEFVLRLGAAVERLMPPVPPPRFIAQGAPADCRQRRDDPLGCRAG